MNIFCVTKIVTFVFEAFENISEVDQVDFFEPPDLLQSTVFPVGIPLGQDRRIRPLCHLSGAKIALHQLSAK
jgi:hypothetical protein